MLELALKLHWPFDYKYKSTPFLNPRIYNRVQNGLEKTVKSSEVEQDQIA